MKNILLISLLFLSGCKMRELDIELPYEGDKIVVYSLLSPSEKVTIKLSKTYPPTGKVTYIDGIKDAEILLYENGIQIEKLVHTEHGIYTSANNFKPKAGFSYSLKITSPTLPTVTTSEEMIPELPVIDSYKFDEKIESSLNKGKAAKKLFLTIKEQTNNEEDFFSVKLLGVWNNNKAGLVDFSIDLANGAESPCYFNYLGQNLIRGICFQNNTYVFKRGYELEAFFKINNNFEKKDIEIVEAQIRKINKSYYEFCKTYYDVTDLEQAFIQPYPRYSNIKGGYGIFTAYNEVILELSPK